MRQGREAGAEPGSGEHNQCDDPVHYAPERVSCQLLVCFAPVQPEPSNCRNCLKSQAECNASSQGLRFLTIALGMVSSLRMQATKALTSRRVSLPDLSAVCNAQATAIP